MIALLLIPLAARAELPPLIPRAALLADPDKLGPQLSPDGRRLAYFWSYLPNTLLYARANGVRSRTSTPSTYAPASSVT